MTCVTPQGAGAKLAAIVNCEQECTLVAGI